MPNLSQENTGMYFKGISMKWHHHTQKNTRLRGQLLPPSNNTVEQLMQSWLPTHPFPLTICTDYIHIHRLPTHPSPLTICTYYIHIHRLYSHIHPLILPHPPTYTHSHTHTQTTYTNTHTYTTPNAHTQSPYLLLLLYYIYIAAQ